MPEDYLPRQSSKPQLLRTGYVDHLTGESRIEIAGRDSSLGIWSFGYFWFEKIFDFFFFCLFAESESPLLPVSNRRDNSSGSGDETRALIDRENSLENRRKIS